MINIKINKTGQEDITKPGGQPAPDIKVDPGKLDIQKQAVNTAMINAGKQIASLGIREYGNITGDYATSNMVDTALGFGADILMIAAGGVVGAIAVGAKYTAQLLSQSVTLELSNRNVDFMRSRMGFVSARGSRYGD